MGHQFGSAALPQLDTLQTWREIARILFVFNILSGSDSSPSLLAGVGLRVPSYSTRRQDFFQIKYRRTYGAFEPINAALNSFNEIAELFDL
jgi:hypothetical protein